MSTAKRQIASKADPVVSVVIPCFNMGHFLDDALNSIYSQTFKNYEVIVVNDGSTDKKTLAKLDDIRGRVQVIDQINKGLPAARNAGVKSAKGRYITCLDADDVLRPAYLERCVRQLQEDQEEVFGFVGVYTRLFELRDDIWKPLDFDVLSLLRFNFFHSATMFRKSAWQKVGGYNEAMRRGYEDWDFWLSLVGAGYKWTVIKSELTGYRIRENSMVTKSNEHHARLYESIVDNHSALFRQYSMELIMALAESIADKDKLLEYNTQLVSQLNLIKHEKEGQVNDLNNKLSALSSKLSAVQERLDRYESHRLVKAAKAVKRTFR